MRFLQLQRRERAAGVLCGKALSTSCSRRCCEPAAEQGLLQEGIGFGSSGGQEGAVTAFRSCPSARHPNSKHKRAKAFFFSLWTASWDAGRLPWGLPKLRCCPCKLLAPGSAHQPLSGNWSSAGNIQDLLPLPVISVAQLMPFVTCR